MQCKKAITSTPAAEASQQLSPFIALDDLTYCCGGGGLKKDCTCQRVWTDADIPWRYSCHVGIAI